MNNGLRERKAFDPIISRVKLASTQIVKWAERELTLTNTLTRDGNPHASWKATILRSRMAANHTPSDPTIDNRQLPLANCDGLLDPC
jgi:hypothetical protein